ncbi:MAG: 4'-phosphopantetheinyl transferase superfamily protein [Acidobacteria bacterium]|nr:4'-phosphopantetheinyl transferase superfamily protein [Acidobacteriota bacterium]
MSRTDTVTLRSIVAQMYGVPAEQIGRDFSLRHPRLRGSAGRGLLLAAIRRRLGVYSSAAVAAATFGELEAALFGEPPSTSSAAEPGPLSDAAPMRVAPVDPTSTHDLLVGLDIELVEAMPSADDFWTHEFYQAHFTAAEIGYCARQEEPRGHFAARWCAKEALKKCDPRFLGEDPRALQVSLDESGRPWLDHVTPPQPCRLPHAVSLTRTAALAAAVVVLPSSTAGR